MRTIALALLCAVSISGCTAFGPKPDTTLAPPPKPVLTKPSPWAMGDCNAPVIPRKGTMTQAQAEALWGADDDSLKDCRARHRILVKYINDRDDGLTGAAN